MQVNCHKAKAFTLLELLTAIAILALLGSVGFAATQGVMVRARQTKCASNLRQLGSAIVSYTQDHSGNFPLTTHGLDVTNSDQAWVYTLAEYLGDVDEMRICPADPKGDERLQAKGTSYLLNSFLTVPKTNPFGEPMGGYTNIHSVPAPVSTPIAFTINFNKGVGLSNDHTHSESWRSWPGVTKDIQPDAFTFGPRNEEHTSGSANYLFVDGHVENLKAETVRQWITEGHNFADPESHRHR